MSSNGVPIDGMRVRSLRHLTNLTQEEIAARVGYSVRLIRKLENGGRVRRSTVVDVITLFQELLGSGVHADTLPASVDELIVDQEQSIADLSRIWFDRAYNQRDLTIINDLMHKDVRLFAEGRELEGRDVIIQRVGMVLQAFSPLKLSVDNLSVDRDVVIAHWSVVKTHIGEFLGIPATGRTVQVSGCSMAKFKDDWIVEVRDHWDVQNLIDLLTK